MRSGSGEEGDGNVAKCTRVSNPRSSRESTLFGWNYLLSNSLLSPLKSENIRKREKEWDMTALLQPPPSHTIHIHDEVRERSSSFRRNLHIFSPRFERERGVFLLFPKNSSLPFLSFSFSHLFLVHRSEQVVGRKVVHSTQLPKNYSRRIGAYPLLQLLTSSRRRSFYSLSSNFFLINNSLSMCSLSQRKL